MTEQGTRDADEAELHAEEIDATRKRLLPNERMLEWFAFRHLPQGEARRVSTLFCELATYLVTGVPRSAERTVALRKLLEGKDAAVRAAMVLD